MAAYFKNLDANKLKPFLIYKYDKVGHRRLKEYNYMMLNQGEQIEQNYVKEGSLRSSFDAREATPTGGAMALAKLNAKVRSFGSSDNLT